MPFRFIAYENLIAEYLTQAMPIKTGLILSQDEYNHDVAKFILKFLEKMIEYNLTPEDIVIGLRGIVHE